jgi:hypothetical protein
MSLEKWWMTVRAGSTAPALISVVILRNGVGAEEFV